MNFRIFIKLKGQIVTSTPQKEDEPLQPGGKHSLTPESKAAVESKRKRFAGKKYTLTF